MLVVPKKKEGGHDEEQVVGGAENQPGSQVEQAPLRAAEPTGPDSAFQGSHSQKTSSECLRKAAGSQPSAIRRNNGDWFYGF